MFNGFKATASDNDYKERIKRKLAQLLIETAKQTTY